ncbi:phage tail sheath family protein [Archangium violaceum]|uniref:phage tail sheath family protein n=1 Tax=Archangium violaceum TaxID=83451 RepID=UPI00194FB51A|nr:phage tail sheath C-terminal domain-containing protein [Archangium violaceum]QRN98998.1 phage tail sheath family protein [Archangium violaceum]
MATSYLTPGIYVEEVSTGAKPLEAVGTSTVGFVGRAPNPGVRQHEAVLIRNWSEFLKVFAQGKDVKSTPLALAVYGFFQNGGTRCFVVNIGDGQRLAGGVQRREGLDVLREVDEVAIVAAPGFTGPDDYDALLTHAEQMQDRVAVLDAPEDATVEQLCEVATVSLPSAGGEGAPGPRRSKGVRARASKYGAYYYPWISMYDPFEREKKLVNVPPSGHIAGIYARVDGLRGVHKAPANEIVRAADGLPVQVTREDQGVLNQCGVNCIRIFREGIKVWGARTLSDDPEWRYLNVRRLFNMVEETIGQGTRWVVFEPNDMSTRRSVERDVGAFLKRLWRDGALVGRTEREAYFVKCDDETNPPEVVDAGQLVAVIGIAPVKPAEFIIFRIGQYAGGAERAEEAGRG